MCRIECRRGRLGHIGNTGSPDLALLVFRGFRKIDTIEADFACADPATRSRIAHCREPDGRLAGAGFADEAQNLAAAKRQIDALNDFVPDILALAFDPQALGLEKHFTSLTHTAPALCIVSFQPSARSSWVRTNPPRNSPPPSAARSPPPAAT